MKKIFIINDLNDILNKKITHFSLDKGLHLGYGLAENNCLVYFLTTGKSTNYNKINFINIEETDMNFLKSMNLIIIVREAILYDLLENYILLKQFIILENRNTKILIKSDSIQWIKNKKIKKYITTEFNIKSKNIINWICKYIDYICVQTMEFYKDAILNNIPENKLLILNMAIPHIKIEYDKLINPYTNNYDYCVKDCKMLNNGLALLPINHIINNNNNNKIIVYTGRIKIDNGKILYFMKEIMNKLDDYELHIFPGSFKLPLDDNYIMNCSATNPNHLNLLREKIFYDSKNIFIHYPYEHTNMYKYLHFAYCGLDFSEIRPKENGISKAGHAKILEYCLVGLPIVCEENINNLFLIKNGKNGIILPYLSNAEQYANAIKQIGNMGLDREYCRNITMKNENCVKRAKELLNLIDI